MKKLLKYLKPYTKQTVISPLFKLLEAVFDLLVPIVIKLIIDRGILAEDFGFVGQMCALLGVFAIVGLGCAIVAQYFAARAAVGFATDLRRDLFAHIQRLSYSETDAVGNATLITRMTADVNQVQAGINFTLRLLLRSPIIVFGAMIMAILVEPNVSLIFIGVIVVLSIIVFSIMLKSIPLYKRVQGNLDRVTALTRENLSGVRVLRAFCKEEDEIARFEAANSEHNRVQNLVGRFSALMNPLTMAVVNGGVILLLLSGGRLVSVGEMTQGDVVAVTNYMAQILVELVKMATTIFTVNKALASADRIERVLEIPAGMPSLPSSEVHADDPRLAVRFDRVSLTYEGNAEKTLSGIDLSVPKGATVGLIGSTGSGKSSLINLIPRFYDASEGAVYVNGQDVRAYQTDELRHKIAVVPQKAVLFSGTVRSNLLWGNPDADDEALWLALERAQAKEFVSRLDLGLDAPVAAGGKNFSGGQRQRLTVARALVRGAEILILDDSSSALDYATDAALRASLRSLPEHPTVFLISQRTSSVRHADMILVLEDGEAVGLGTHEELLENCPVYREIHNSQFKREEDSHG